MYDGRNSDTYITSFTHPEIHMIDVYLCCWFLSFSILLLRLTIFVYNSIPIKGWGQSWFSCISTMPIAYCFMQFIPLLESLQYPVTVCTFVPVHFSWVCVYAVFSNTVYTGSFVPLCCSISQDFSLAESFPHPMLLACVAYKLLCCCLGCTFLSI